MSCPSSDTSLPGRIGGHQAHATSDNRESTQPGCTTLLERFVTAVDPDRRVTIDERRAAQARKVYSARLGPVRWRCASAPPILTIRAAAPERLHFTEATICSLIRSGRLPARQYSSPRGHYLIERDLMDSFLGEVSR